MLLQAMVVLITCAAEAPPADPARKLTDGFFYDAQVAARMEAGTLTAQDEGAAVNVSFRGKTVKVDYVMEDETFPCTVVKKDDNHWVIETRNGGEVKRYAWTWTGPGRVKTELAGGRELVWLPQPFRNYAQAARNKRMAGGGAGLGAKAFQAGDGTRLTVEGSSATWAGKKEKAAVVDCLLDCDTGKPARCLVLGKKVPYKAIFLQQGSTLEEVMMPGLCPDGLGVERQESPRVFQPAQ